MIEFNRCFSSCGPPGMIKKIGRVPAATKQRLPSHYKTDVIYRESRHVLQRLWQSTSVAMQRLRDTLECADAETANIADNKGTPVSPTSSFNPKDNILPFDHHHLVSPQCQASRRHPA